ncbi:hypothetical protein EXS73_02850 [Candidatus Pacearchaeota archaeon]|nr:hypothetical protein [Candidatus Pacearchaeota archaeon]
MKTCVRALGMLGLAGYLTGCTVARTYVLGTSTTPASVPSSYTAPSTHAVPTASSGTSLVYASPVSSRPDVRTPAPYSFSEQAPFSSDRFPSRGWTLLQFEFKDFKRQEK